MTNLQKKKRPYDAAWFIEQDLLNDDAYGKVRYLSLRFGQPSPYDDKHSDRPPNFGLLQNSQRKKNLLIFQKVKVK